MKLYAWDLQTAQNFARTHWAADWSRERIASYLRDLGRGGLTLRRVFRAFDDFQRIEK